MLHARVLAVDHAEGDERVFHALVEQMDRGRGFTLQGHPLLAQGNISATHYDHPLFLHPPGGFALFWLLQRLAGDVGFSLAQLLSYALFFFAVMLLALELELSSLRAWWLTAALAAFHPIVVHVGLHQWLDGPLLAFSTLAVALWIRAQRHDSVPTAILAGMVLGYASWIKATAFLVVAPAWLLARAASNATPFVVWKRSLLFAGIAAAAHLPWLLWQKLTLGTALPPWMGRPTEAMLAASPYLSFVTTVRPPWAYFTVTPRVLWSSLPAVAGWLAFSKNLQIRREGGALAFWIFLVLLVHAVLGAFFASKLLRYVVLMAPASILLAAMVADQRPSSPVQRLIQLALWVGAALEVAQGISTGLAPSELSLILPLWGQP
jgi:4-amino-4-deoxy-L-arabinose transferase-like glycosyltransferase